MAKNFSLANAAKHPTPKGSFLRIKETVLGKQYELSLVFIPPRRMRELNRQYRKKDSATDILSFGLTEHSGEIYLCMQEVKKKAPSFGMDTKGYLAFLCVHGMLHLQGYDHGAKMETLEKKFCKQLKIPNNT